MAAHHVRYTHGHHESVLRSHTWRTIANSAAYLEPELVPGRSLLDVGSGPGTITAEFAERLAPGRVVGVDAAPEIVEKATALGSAAEFVVGDALALPFEDGAFDIVHAHQTLQHLGDPVRALEEMRRVVARDGVVAVRDVDYAGVIWYPLIPALDEWLVLYHRLHRANGGEPDAGRRLKAWARAAGFREIASSASIWTFASDDDRAWWGGLWAERALESAFAVDAVERGHATRAELERVSAGWLEWAQSPDGWLAMPHGEVLARG
jgi:ubiquinone/menaquinone biosynthesis C-methylase UbiE